MTRPRAARAVVPSAAVRPLAVALGVASGLLVLIAAPSAARADDGTAAWAVAPSDEAGNLTGDTRFELEVAPGQSVTEHVLVTNSSTVERAFEVYGADGFNTPTGGYDVDAAAVSATDVGSWVDAGASPVTVPALSTAVVEFTVTVPEGAAPGDHPGGLVVSPQRGQVTADGVLVDTRIAVRLNVRVPGELAPALEVRRVGAAYGFSAVPFGSASTDVHFEVVNTGNVKVIGVPRLRLTGPFGIRLADVEADETHEVLPGESFTISTTVEGVEPLFFATATVDVQMTAAPGPDTEIPGVSATARAAFAAVPWTGVALVVVLVVGAVVVVRAVRRRRREGERLWDRVVDEARADLEAGRAPRTASAVGGGALVALFGTLMLLGAPQLQANDTDDGSLSLTVPAATASPTASSSASPSSAPSSSTRPPRGSSSVSPPLSSTGGEGSAGDGSDVGADEHEAPPSAASPRKPDLLWTTDTRRWSALQWTLVGTAGAGAAGLVAWVVRFMVVSRRGVAS